MSIEGVGNVEGRDESGGMIRSGGWSGAALMDPGLSHPHDGQLSVRLTSGFSGGLHVSLTSNPTELSSPLS
jgi:hypothetical protein